MKAMVLLRSGIPLKPVERTDLEPKLPTVPGHEIVGTVAALGHGVNRFQPGDRIGVPWLGHACGQCRNCQSDMENLCDQPGFGMCERMVAQKLPRLGRIHG